jgi:hypothetical protein
VRRYAGDEAQQVIVIGGLEAPRRQRRSRPADPGAKPVDVTRATVIAADPLDGEAHAEAWLRDAADELIARSLAVLNRALHARRIASADPYACEVALRHALVTRVGYGTGEQVAEGRWIAARELPPERARIARESALRPQERFAALLAGRDATLACELLALRARLDLDQGRDFEAALQLEAALGAGLAELEGWRELDGMAERLAELRSRASGVVEAAAAARAGTLDEAGRGVVEQALARLEAALRARTAGAQF